jgi:hypothetical protein
MKSLNNKSKITFTLPENLRPYKRYAKPAFISVVAVVFVIGSVWVMYHKQNKKPALTLEPPKALASDLPGWWYEEYFGSSICDKEYCITDKDPDNDKLTNGQEYFYKTNPLVADTNGNGKSDGEDVANNIDPSKEKEMTFEQSASDEEILGESLVFQEDVISEINNTIDPNRVVLKEIPDSSIRIVEDSESALKKYIDDAQRVMNNHIVFFTAEGVEEAIKTNDVEEINRLKEESKGTHAELIQIEVPKTYVQLHKYMLRNFELLPIVIVQPQSGILFDEYDVYSNYWTDAVQQFMVNFDRMNAELNKLQN